MPPDYPPTWRVALAFIVAPGVAALAMAIAMPAYDGVPGALDRIWRTAVLFSLFGAYPTALVFGVPAYLIGRRHLSVRPIWAVLVGALVAALPWVAILLLGPGATEASIDGHPTVLHGHTTAYGWLQNAEFVMTIGLFGAIGGFAFWAVAAAGRQARLPSGDR